MDFMNLNQAAHGDREYAHMVSRMSVARKIVVGEPASKAVGARVTAWTHAAIGWNTSQNLKLARFGDNMRYVSVTDGDKVSAQMQFGMSIEQFGVNTLVEAVAKVSDSAAEALCEVYEREYDVVAELRKGGARHDSLVYGANVVAIRGHYDEVNRLCAEIAGKYGWAFVNVNMRPYYAEGSKSMGFEIQEQLGWRIPEHTVVCMASGSLLTKIHKSYQEFSKLGLVQSHGWKIHGAQATGCSPITTAQKAGLDFFKPVKPNTIAKSLAIGTPADGFYALKVMKETGGHGEDVSDDEIREGIRLLAETEGIFAETAGGVTVGVAKKLIAQGKIPADSSAVLCITGNGLKTLEAMLGHCGESRVIKPSLREFETLLTSDQVDVAGSR
jgi:threonine synthase